MNLLADLALGLAVMFLLLVRYGVILPDSVLHRMIGWKGYPLWWTPVRSLDDGAGDRPPHSWPPDRTPEVGSIPQARQDNYLVCPPSYPTPAGFRGPVEVPCSSCGRPVTLLNRTSALQAVQVCHDCFVKLRGSGAAEGW